jgi:hypothetical protein
LKRSAEADRPQAGGYNISQTALNIYSSNREKAIDQIGQRTSPLQRQVRVES